jgi:hypothetical protein
LTIAKHRRYYFMNTISSETQSSNPAQQFAREVVDTSIDLNNITKSGGVNTFVFGCHYIDLKTGACGIKQLLHAILASRGYSHPQGAEKTALRPIVIAGSMFYSDLENEVRRAFCVAGIRYPKNTLRVYLANSKNEKDNKIQSIQLLGTEDATRTSPKPRAKYFLAE